MELDERDRLCFIGQVRLVRTRDMLVFSRFSCFGPWRGLMQMESYFYVLETSNLPALYAAAKPMASSTWWRATTGAAMQKAGSDYRHLSAVSSGQFEPECVPTLEFVTSA